MNQTPGRGCEAAADHREHRPVSSLRRCSFRAVDPPAPSGIRAPDAVVVVPPDQTLLVGKGQRLQTVVYAELMS